MKRPLRPRTLSLEPLESRDVPTQFGVPWANPEQMTLSFAPDGTATPTGPSSLASTLGAAGSAAAKREILRAFQTWAVNTNVNVGVVADGGQPLGTRGAVQGDARFGDVRIAAAPAGSNEVATASPFSWSGTTYSGDVVFDSREAFRIGNTTAGYDVFSVAAHEAGHVFGLDHSTEPGSVLGESFDYRTGLTAGDVARIRALYGARQDDAHDRGWLSNDTPATATNAGLLGTTLKRFVADGDLTTLADADYYKISVPLGLGAVSVRLVTEGKSLLLPSVTVYDSLGRKVTSGLSVDPLNNDVSLRFTPSLLLGTYYIKVDGATSDVFGMGGYQLVVDTLTSALLAPPPLPTVQPVVDGHTNDSIGTASVQGGDGLLGSLLGLGAQPDARFDAVVRGVIEDTTDVDFYQITAPNTGLTSDPLNLNVMVWATETGKLNPRVRVYDASGAAVPFRVAANDAGVMSVQLADVRRGAKYYVQVSSREAGGTGQYFFAADFHQLAQPTFDGVAGGSLGTAGTVSVGTLTVANGGLFQFALTAEMIATGSGAVELEVLNAAGGVEFTVVVPAGGLPVTAIRYLTAGTYLTRFKSATTGPVEYGLYMLELSNPIGPYKSSTSTSSGTTSGSTTSGSSSGYTYSSMSDSESTGYGYSY